MRTNQYSNLTMAFYVTYLVFELPTGYLMQRLPTAKYLGFNGMLLSSWCITLAKSFSRIMGPHDHFELCGKELWWSYGSSSTIRMLRKRYCPSVRVPHEL